MNNNYLICCLMVLILILFIVDICKKKKDKEGFESTTTSNYLDIVNLEILVHELKTDLDLHKYKSTLKAHTYCFTSNSILQTPKCSKYMKDLKIGDYILGHHNGKDKYVKIKGWIHKVDNKECEMLEITTENNNKLKMSERHLLPRNTKDNYVFAGELKVGDTLFLTNNKKTKVKSIKLYKTNGYYAPYCSEGLIYVDGVLAHIFAEIKNPDKYLPMYDNLFNFYENTFDEKITNDYMHPVAKMSSVLLPFIN